MIRIVNIHAAKTHLSRLVEEAIQGQEIVIAKSGRPLVRLSPVTGDNTPRRPGSLKGRITMGTDFDDALPDDLVASFEGRT